MPLARSASSVLVRVTIAALAFVAGCGSGGPPARVTIPAGATMRAAADSLSSAGVVRFPKLFSVYAKLRGRDRDIKAGTYVLAVDTGLADRG